MVVAFVLVVNTKVNATMVVVVMMTVGMAFVVEGTVVTIFAARQITIMFYPL
jgi:hypothetical protein